MGGFKDKDLIQDDCGKTKHRQYGQHKRPPRMQQRKNQRERYLNKDEKRDMSAQELDFKLDDNGQVYVQQEPSTNQVLTFKDIVQMPSDVQDIRKYHDYNVDLEQSLNDIGGGFGIQVNQEKQQNPVQFDFVDTNIKQPQEADVSNDDLILSEQQDGGKQEDPFDAILNDNSDETSQEENTEQQTIEEDNKQEENTEQQNKQTTEQNNDEEQNKEQSNDAIDEYLKMQIDDSKLSEQNKQKLDSFTEQQMDAFKKFLYQKRNNEE